MIGLLGAGLLAGGSLLGGFLQGKGQRDAAKMSNQQMQWLYNPTRINQAAGQLSPWWNAVQAGRYNGSNPFYQQMFNLAMNPGYMDPQLMNLPFTQIEMGANRNLGRFQGMVGRSNAGGGLATAYGLANLAGRTQQRAQAAQQYGMWREQQRRQDLQFINDLIARSQGTAAGLATQQGQSYTAPMPWSSIGGNAIQGGLAAISTIPGLWGQFPKSNSNIWAGGSYTDPFRNSQIPWEASLNLPNL